MNHLTRPKVQLNIKDRGIITLELCPEAAPKTVKNFLEYVNSGFYDGLIFHRVIPGFMIQGGGFTPEMTQKPNHRQPIENEANSVLKNDMYTIAMARTQAPHSASSQFFINAVNNGFLDHTAPTMAGWGYCVFGEVIDGKKVVDGIAAAATHNRGGHGDVPKEPIIITTATSDRR